MLVNILSALLAANAVAAHWPPTFVACTSDAPSGATSTESKTLDACISDCTSQSLKYSYFDSSKESCSCSDSINHSAVATADPKGTCSDSWTVTQLSAEYSYDTCGDKLSQEPEFVDVEDTAKCFLNCNDAGKAAAILSPTPAGSDETKGWKCACVDEASTAETAIECTASSYFIFKRATESATPPGASPPTASAAARKRRRAAETAKKEADKKLCGPGQRACKLKDSDNWACADISHDLEACGGCPYGDFEDNGNKSGIDCTALPNIAMRNGKTWVGCEAGTCKIHKCANGFVPSLDNKECGPQNPKSRRS